MCSSCSSASGSSDPVSAFVAARQAQISQQAALKAAKMAMDISKESGTRLIESLIKSANAAQAGAAEGMIDVLA